MFHCHVWKPDGIWNWQLKLEDPEGQAILSPVSTPKCSMHTGPTMFVFSVGLPFSRFPVFFWKPPNKSPAICDLSRTYRYVTYLLNILQVLQISCCFSRKKGKQFSHWGVVSAIPIPDTPTEVPDWQVLPPVIWVFPRKAGHLANQTGAFSKKNDLSILKQQCRFNTPGNWWCARKLTNHRSKVTQSLTSNRVVLKFP